MYSKKGSRRFAGAAAAISALATTLWLVPSASAQTAARAGPTAAGSASAAAAPRSSACSWFPIPASFFVGDPVALYPSIDGRYNRPGFKGVAFKITGVFPHSTTMSFTTYDDIFELEGPQYLINDSKIIPDPGSKNPFVPGTRVEATPRHYTVYIWPDSIPVPKALKNVVLYPTKAKDPRDKAAQYYVTMRLYHMQSGHSALAAMRSTKVNAVSAYNPSKYVRCPVSKVGSIFREVQGTFRHVRIDGPIQQAPEPPTGNKIYFTRYVAKSALGLEGFPADGCANYNFATVPRDEISVVTMHAVPQYFNNNLVTPSSIMKDYQTRYLSETVIAWPEYPAISVNTDNAVYRPDGSWVTIYLPSKPRLTRSQLKHVREVARKLSYNVIQLPRKPSKLRPVASLLPPGPMIVVRYKAASSTFPYPVTAIPCWAQNHDYRTYHAQTSRAFFAKYASSPRNQGPYYTDGVRLTFGQFMSQFSK